MTYRESFIKFSQLVKPARLMAVSKTRTLDEIKNAYDAGFRLFGENHVQEIVQKFTDYKPEDLELHMIGHLQSNKVSKVVKIVDMIESVDSLSLLQKIDAQAKKIDKVMSVLLEFNTSSEEAKSGFLTENELFSCIEESKKLTNIKICGLMTVGPVSCPKEQKDELTDKAFKYLKSLKEKCSEMFPEINFDILSMGMSGDYQIAVKNSSTEVRIGTAIFGERVYV